MLIPRSHRNIPRFGHCVIHVCWTALQAIISNAIIRSSTKYFSINKVIEIITISLKKKSGGKPMVKKLFRSFYRTTSGVALS